MRVITVDLHSPVPLEDQLRNAIRLAIARGDVAPGDQLPSVRQLANDLAIHWNTVARAYRRLRDEGLLTVGRGRRVTVRDRKATPDDNRRAKSSVRQRFRDALAEGRIAGLTLDQLEDLLRRELEEWGPPRSGGAVQ